MGEHQTNDGFDETVGIRPARIDERDLLARFHMNTHPTAFLPTLGPRVMQRLYQALLSDAEAVAYVAERDGEVIGFSTGVVSVPAFYKRFYRRQGPRVALAVLPRLVRPKVLRKIYETARYPDHANADLPPAEFTTLAVAPGIRSKGLGGRLSEAVLAGLKERGVDECRGTVHHSNEPMNRMMTRIGFVQVGEFAVHDGSPSIVYVIDLRGWTPTHT
jgi:ribosomal protein S18 acetylase RimI-like enzyme